MKKPINSKTHGIIDYAFAGIQLFVPALLGMNDKATKTYQSLGFAFLGVNCITDTPVGIRKTISLKSHQKADAGFLAGLAVLTTSRNIHKDKKTLVFHLGFFSLAVVNYLLTDYNNGS
jgi:hypothetical protein